MNRLLSWAGTLLFLPALGAILLVFDPAQRLARLFGQRPQEYVAGALQVALARALGLCGVRLAVDRSPGVRPWASYIIVSNHQSMLDIPILGTLFFRNFPKYVSKRSLGHWIPSVSYNLRRGGHVLIDRGDAPRAIEAIRELGTRVGRGGLSALIFPEGTRARVGELGEFRRGGLAALLEAAPDAPVVPVAIDESWRLLRRSMFPMPWGVRVRIHIGDPIPRRPGEDRNALMTRAHDEIAAALARWRAPS